MINSYDVMRRRIDVVQHNRTNFSHFINWRSFADSLEIFIFLFSANPFMQFLIIIMVVKRDFITSLINGEYK